MKQEILDKFYLDMNFGFDSNLIHIDKIAGNKVYYNFQCKNYVYDTSTKQNKEIKGENMAYQFRTKNGKETDIFHSYPYYKATAKQRNDLAFNKQILSKLSEKDQWLLRGLAEKIIRDNEAFKYRNPDYQRKTTGKWKPTPTKSLNDQFFN